MGIYRGPRIITSGLQLALDAGSNRSYPNSGTTWIDLSGGDNNGILSNEAIGTTDLGSMTFSGNTSNISLPVAAVSGLTNTGTITLWVKPDDNRGTNIGWLQGDGKALSMWREDATNVGFAVDGEELLFTIPQVEIESDWHNYALTIDGTNVKAYWDSVYKTGFTYSTPIPTIGSLLVGNLLGTYENTPIDWDWRTIADGDWVDSASWEFYHTGVWYPNVSPTYFPNQTFTGTFNTVIISHNIT